MVTLVLGVLFYIGTLFMKNNYDGASPVNIYTAVF